jgi:hypothetical protein
MDGNHVSPATWFALGFAAFPLTFFALAAVVDIINTRQRKTGTQKDLYSRCESIERIDGHAFTTGYCRYCGRITQHGVGARYICTRCRATH